WLYAYNQIHGQQNATTDDLATGLGQACMQIRGFNHVVRGNICKGRSTGIMLADGDGVVVEDNWIEDCEIGIWNQKVANAKIRRNDVAALSRGIHTELNGTGFE